jgi:hypothetical protein
MLSKDVCLGTFACGREFWVVGESLGLAAVGVVAGVALFGMVEGDEVGAVAGFLNEGAELPPVRLRALANLASSASSILLSSLEKVAVRKVMLSTFCGFFT